MSALIWARRDYYRKLMKQFARGDLPASQFVRAFLDAREEDLRKEYESRSEGDRQADQQVLERFQRGDLSGDEFLRRSAELWAYPADDKWLSIFDRVFMDLDAFEQDPGELAELQKVEPWRIGEDELRSRIQRYLAELDSSS